ncbi:MAG TPA: hypothetical protein VFU11_03750 [Solirubrobacterales bacterium]|nr:hypothetical protein [Solirubrobacterales bacterium]
MARWQFPLLCIVLLTLAGCGGEADTSPSSKAGANRYFGDHPGQEATKAAISESDCRALKRETEAEIGAPLRVETEPTPPSSRCQLRGHGVSVSIYLDAAYAARQRYYNRVVEQDQFYGTDPAKHPHPVSDVGDPGAYGHTASWIPAFSTLWAVRGNRWLTVAYSAPGMSRPRRREAAAALARSAFRLTAG